MYYIQVRPPLLRLIALAPVHSVKARVTYRYRTCTAPLLESTRSPGGQNTRRLIESISVKASPTAALGETHSVNFASAKNLCRVSSVGGAGEIFAEYSTLDSAKKSCIHRQMANGRRNFAECRNTVSAKIGRTTSGHVYTLGPSANTFAECRRPRRRICSPSLWFAGGVEFRRVSASPSGPCSPSAWLPRKKYSPSSRCLPSARSLRCHARQTQSQMVTWSFLRRVFLSAKNPSRRR